MPIVETASAIVKPSAAATSTSLSNSAPQSDALTSPVASARTINVADCEPALPLLSISNGRKNTSATFAAMVSSKLAMAAPEKILAKTSASNQPTRLLYSAENGACL